MKLQTTAPRKWCSRAIKYKNMQFVFTSQLLKLSLEKRGEECTKPQIGSGAQYSGQKSHKAFPACVHLWLKEHYVLRLLQSCSGVVLCSEEYSKGDRWPMGDRES